MTTAQVVETVKASAELVWKHMGDFAGIQPGGMIVSCTVKGEGVGMERTVTLTNGIVKERLDNHDTERMTMSYSIINDDCPLPVSNYSSTLTISANEDGESCTIHWTGTFDPKGVEEEKAIHIVKSIYTRGIQEARVTLTPPATP